MSKFKKNWAKYHQKNPKRKDRKDYKRDSVQYEPRPGYPIEKTFEIGGETVAFRAFLFMMVSKTEKTTLWTCLNCNHQFRNKREEDGSRKPKIYSCKNCEMTSREFYHLERAKAVLRRISFYMEEREVNYKISFEFVRRELE